MLGVVIRAASRLTTVHSTALMLCSPQRNSTMALQAPAPCHPICCCVSGCRRCHPVGCLAKCETVMSGPTWLTLTHPYKRPQRPRNAPAFARIYRHLSVRTAGPAHCAPLARLCAAFSPAYSCTRSWGTRAATLRAWQPWPAPRCGCAVEGSLTEGGGCMHTVVLQLYNTYPPYIARLWYFKFF